MVLGSRIRKLLHGYGIHSATIQPEFIEDQLDEKSQFDDDDETNSDSKLIIHGVQNASPLGSALTDSSNDVK